MCVEGDLVHLVLPLLDVLEERPQLEVHFGERVVGGGVPCVPYLHQQLCVLRRLRDVEEEAPIEVGGVAHAIVHVCPFRWPLACVRVRVRVRFGGEDEARVAWTQRPAIA